MKLISVIGIESCLLLAEINGIDSRWNLSWKIGDRHIGELRRKIIGRVGGDRARGGFCDQFWGIPLAKARRLADKRALEFELPWMFDEYGEERK